MKTSYAHQNDEESQTMKKLIQAPTVTIQDNQILAKDQPENDIGEEETPKDDKENNTETEKKVEPPF